jgi:hypothetical protein
MILLLYTVLWRATGRGSTQLLRQLTTLYVPAIPKEPQEGFMKSVILMFVGGLMGGLIGPVAALMGVAAGFFIGRYACRAALDNPPN